MRLTKATVEQLEPREKKWVAWDDKVAGLGVCVYPAGNKSWVLDYRTKERTQRRQTLGRADVVHPDTARQMAREVLVQVAKGSDPMQQLRIKLAEPTIADLEAAFTPEHTRTVKKTTQNGNASLWSSQLLPRLGKKRILEIDRADIADFLAELQGTPYVANRCVRLLSKAYSMAALRHKAWGWPPVERNPCQRAKLHPEEKRQRYLTPEELERLLASLDAWPATEIEWRFANAIRLLLLTGCRRGEILTATWAMVDEKNGLLRLSDSKTGAKDVHLPAEALPVLQELRRRTNGDLVIAGDVDGRPISGHKKMWARLLAHAQIKAFRIHDIRHSFASFGIKAKLSLPEIGGLLGHKSAQTTQRYAHLMDDVGKAASAAVMAAMFTPAKA
jgi:integrase